MSEIRQNSTLALTRQRCNRSVIVLRLCTINPRTTEEDLRDTIHKLENFGRQLSTTK